MRVLINFFSGMSKLVIWKTRKDRVRDEGSEDASLMRTGLLGRVWFVDNSLWTLGVWRTSCFQSGKTLCFSIYDVSFLCIN